jgi:acylphosphatase
MKRVIAIVQGDVQSVGYRDRVLRIARKFEIKGFVENLKPYDVKITAEGEEDSLNRFLEEIKIKKYPILVEDIDLRWEEPKNEFEYFEIKRGEWREELFERLDLAGNLLYRSVELGERSVELGERSVELGERSVELGERSVELGERSVELGEKSVGIGEKMLDKQDKMLDKQDETIGILKDVKKDTAMISFIKEDTGVMRGSLKSLEEIYKETIELHHKYDKLERDIELIKTKLSIT